MASFDYIFDGRPQPPTLILQEDAHILKTSGYLRLTKTTYDIPHCRSTGRVIHAPKLEFQRRGAEVDFKTTLKFYISSTDSSPANGITFFIAPTGHPVPPGSFGGNFGIFNTSGTARNVFAVEFDTDKRAGDLYYEHVGIDIESNVSKVIMRVDEALIDQEVTANIEYKAATHEISVEVTAGGKNFEFLGVHDLGAVLKPEVQVGISASTGRDVAVHDVISWSFSSYWSGQV